MAVFQQNLDRCFANNVSAPDGGGCAKRRPKRARDDDESVGSAVGVAGVGVENREVKTGRKKRVKHESGERMFACPFSKHDPVKYRNVKTCCGPGWKDVHRVK